MSIPYAPYIADTIPGFLTTSVKIPFTMNPAVSWKEIYGFKLQIKDYNGTNVIATLLKKKPITRPSYLIFEEFEADWVPIVGQWCKFQLAYTTQENGVEVAGSFSSVSIGKCVGEEDDFSVSIKDLEEDVDNFNKGVYIGQVTTPYNEPVYSYRFTCGNQNTGEILYASNNSYKFKIDHEIIMTHETSLQPLQFHITTINGYQQSSPSYYLNSENEDPIEDSEIFTFVNNELGCVKINIDGIAAEQNYSLERTIDKEHYEELIQFKTPAQTSYTCNDYSVEQGVGYYYSIRKVDENGAYQSSRLFTTQPVYCDYEDIFLTDTTGKQLKIKFDPKVSSFKDIIQESKIETIGSQYPFFFRNGQIKYKEIPISGLISYNMDEDFMSDEELGIRSTYSHAAAGQDTHIPSTTTVQRGINLDGPNFAAERKFKLKVMEWLNDGTPKLFRSPGEGVYVIRLINVSLSPNDTLGRMLHSFSATGYEVSEHDLELLKQKGFINFPQPFTPSSKLGYFVLGYSELGDEEVSI